MLVHPGLPQASDKSTTQCPRPGLQPEPPDPGLSELTMMPTFLPFQFSIPQSNMGFTGITNHALSLEKLFIIDLNICKARAYCLK